MSTHGHETSGSAYDDGELAALPLAGARQDLLEAIMATPVPTRTPDHDSLDGRPVSRHRGWLAAGLAAATVAAAVAVPAFWLRGDDPSQPPVGAGTTAAPEPSPADDTGQAEGADGAGLTAAEPDGTLVGQTRVLLDEPGWEVTYVDLQGGLGTLVLGQGDREIELNWYPAKAYDSYFSDRDDPRGGLERLGGTTMLGRSATSWAYGPGDYATMRTPEDGSFVEARGHAGDRAAYEALLDRLVHVDRATFEAALTGDAVAPADRLATIEEMLADVPVPAGFQAGDVPGGGDDAQDRYQVGAAVTGTVACRWLQQYETATTAGDDAAATEAADALRSSRDWAVLREMEAEGDYPEVLWEISRQVDRGEVPREYAQGLGCD
ncbi:hypothetical protein G7072_16275 [Nocardioides sp. HDW12B]|uniref:hypothetical protein n=1 Tax=Nocardioides sp. HDW12B TaxID=2714939 RepID=UPI00140D3CFF|nr:hypothetical protein [Nocardioides sp. HDW12B]QIK67697.1 hypothetical protein G7072_16275 [Nocardioides sp. HDW12B]